MKIILAFFLLSISSLVLVGCEERYRYPCQNPDNWDKDVCKKPYCSANGTCPEDLTHYLKDGDKGRERNKQQAPEVMPNKGANKC